MADITLISGSTLGSAEYVAEHLAEKLEEAGYSTENQHGPLVDDLQAQGIWLIISSTHGAGDIPDNLVPFYAALQEKQAELGSQCFDIDPNVGKVAVVGVGMKTHSGLAAKFFNALSEKGVNVLMISTSEIRIAALVPLEQLNDAVKALHTA